MGVNKYIFDPTVVAKVLEEQRHIRSELQEVFSSAKNLKERLEVNEGWKGKQKEIMLDMLEALIKYHADVTGGKDGKNNSPYDALIIALTKLEKDINKNVEDIPAYKVISKI